MKIFKKTPNINFLDISKYMLICSALFLCIGVFLLFYSGLNASIDFTGGTVINVSISNNDEIDIVNLRKKFANALSHNVNIVEIHNENNIKSIIITTDFLEDETTLNQTLNDCFGNQFNIEQIESIGPKIGDELQSNARNAILTSLLLIGIYITIRFNTYYALGSLAALLHDILFILSMFALLKFELSIAIIAALLTIAGYSLNDTIVIYDRIRENFLKYAKSDSKDVINQSLNETLNRTIVTSVTTLLVVVVLYIYGGEVLQPFALALIIGVGVGTYSSLFIASPIMYLLAEKYNIESEEEEQTYVD